MPRRMAELTKTSLCLIVALVLAACADGLGRAAGDTSSQAAPAPSPQAAATPADRASAAATVTPAPTGTSSTTNPATAPPSSTPPQPTAGPTETAEPDDPSPSPPDSPSQRELLEAEVVELTNAERAAAGCQEVQVHDRLVAAARGHSEDMVERDFFDHTNPDGDGPGDRARAAGYNWLAISENIAWGHRTAEEVVAGWMDSAGHRRNILDCDMVEVGVGFSDSPRGPYWTQMFGRS